MATSSPRTQRPRARRDRAPWDPAIGLRVGAVTGSVVGAVVMVATGVINPWILVGGAMVGGAVGYWSQRTGRPSRPARHRRSDGGTT